MGNFKGHALPGSFFILFAVWWAIKYPLRYRWRQRKLGGGGGGGGGGPTGLPASCVASENRLDIIEGAVKTVFSIVGMMAEQFVPDGPHMRLYNRQEGGWDHLMNWQHTTMYLFFAISGVADIVTHTCRGMPLRGLDRLMLALAVFVEGYLFYFHLHGRTMLDVHVHTLLLLPVFTGSLTIFLEVFLRDNAILELLRTSFALLQGTWFFQIGFVLYPPNGAPEWDQADMGNMMFITMCFCWHFAGAILYISLSYTAVFCLGNLRNRGVPHMELGTLLPLSKNHNKEKGALLADSEEE
ncbi:transmembrane protein 45B [Petromyzon marinus]|uniref:Transmembrane protein 45B isoform X1 n=1 Tax=Petromyzon marinus TaxID=7757 RepID=A0AAJ7TNB8_PETMA|nr:transmembrane protein 45B isoform X1 [Petromyzon marinus]XP_032820557.1 transmembrane protein 45B isoform X1 [Petromyzon marinus]XP_032820558.1 transmembrane protein 45B isoform X1 [Petromyzon marinus]XP_032820559.1 transmembrane protein 45B isoform X1 [Petromyzon marinus]XP_032820560.1 transmembrane protein 45B isoform X1 [Petromyzon marinus]XP_032820562.1 transmembrane protein 45B isoform X1 [Petromyzon marinus]XP_032820563.1 transmembrane protein 45B isoform X1 [Petromyzon marinus]XP_0